MRLVLAFGAAASLWNIVIASRGARASGASGAHPVLRALTALVGILLVPAMLVAMADGSLLTARVTQQIWWLWPATVAGATLQAAWVAVRRLVSPLLSVPFVLWNALLLLGAVSRALPDLHVVTPEWLGVVSAALTHAVAAVAGPVALTSPLAVAPAFLAPAAPSRWRQVELVRAGVAALAGAATIVVLAEVPSARAAIGSYARYGAERLPDRPASDFTLGLRLLPAVERTPSPQALRLDMAVADSIETEAMLVEVAPSAAAAALDSLARTLEPWRRDSVLVAIRLGGPLSLVGSESVERVVRHLHPDVLLFGAPATGDGRAGDEERVVQHALLAHRLLPSLRVGVVASAVDADREREWFDWGRTRAVGLAVVAVELRAGADGAADLDEQMAWLRQRLALAPNDRAVWITGIGTVPVAHGEASQELAWRGMLAASMRTAGIRAVFAGPASDVETMTGIRGASGRLRPVVRFLAGASRRLREGRDAAAATPP